MIGFSNMNYMSITSEMLTPKYLLLDGARADASLDVVREISPRLECLYKGSAQVSLGALAPYLIPLQAGSRLAEEYMANGWGNSWGVLFSCSHPMVDLVDHFRKFLIVHTEDYKELYFRFYDPRVLRIFLPTCDSSQLKEFFGPVTVFVCEDEDSEYAILFTFTKGILNTERRSKTSLFPGQGTSSRALAEGVVLPEAISVPADEDTRTIQAERPVRKFFS